MSKLQAPIRRYSVEDRGTHPARARGVGGAVSRSLRHGMTIHQIRAFQHPSPPESLAESTSSDAFSGGDLRRNPRTS
ncbi:MAG: hypothetical protein H6836_09625 [Planctomycetes bacterium]|nr:hypothetical protein [Planctomycetota bacterium]MCB9889823.1 hypothetical protein [Planctomycetota bacterium]